MKTVYAYNWVPDFAKGFVRDLRVRWALEEAGLEYEVKLIDHQEKLTADYRALQPFSQVPAYQDGGLTLFESGAIALEIGRHSDALLPVDPVARARATAWVIAALNSVEPSVMALTEIVIFNPDAPWADARRGHVETQIKKRLQDLADHIGQGQWLEDCFTVGDLMMADVLRNLGDTDFVTADPVLGPYLARCLDRPAFKAAMAAQMASFDDSLAPTEGR